MSGISIPLPYIHRPAKNVTTERKKSGEVDGGLAPVVPQAGRFPLPSTAKAWIDPTGEIKYGNVPAEHDYEQ
jgi:hypothetical protein